MASPEGNHNKALRKEYHNWRSGVPTFEIHRFSLEFLMSVAQRPSLSSEFRVFLADMLSAATVEDPRCDVNKMVATLYAAALSSQDAENLRGGLLWSEFNEYSVIEFGVGLHQLLTTRSNMNNGENELMEKFMTMIRHRYEAAFGSAAEPEQQLITARIEHCTTATSSGLPSY